jgi:hypothetical protein
MAKRDGQGWKWELDSNQGADIQDASFHTCGPLRWEFETTGDTRHTSEARTISAPCWLVAPLLAAWPLTGITLLMHRRTRRRRRERVGCCLHCGYDLRATAEKNGPLLSRCPECGAEYAAVLPKTF